MGTITVSNLGKAYKQYPTRWSRLAEWVIPRAKPRHRLKWVLQDISFKVNPGEAVGIIGINGAGKSTLLKMITGTTMPTTGSVRMEGRVAALLELGMGFHADFTGRQNAVMAGQLLGYAPGDVERLMPKIEAFAEIGEYIDAPVRVYSSGMQVRLAFAVATAIRPDILIVDEALSVGDSYFQHKSFDRIREFRRQGTTLLIVSHDKQAIQSICDRAILLNEGRLEKEGEPALVMDFYNALAIKKADSNIVIRESGDNAAEVVSGNQGATVEDVFICNARMEPTEVVQVGEDVCLRIRARVLIDIPRLVMGYQIKDRLGQPVFGTNTQYTEQPIEQCKAGDLYEYRVWFTAAIGPGSYSIATSLVDTDGVALHENYEWRELVATFTVVNVDKAHFIGSAWIEPKIEISKA